MPLDSLVELADQYGGGSVSNPSSLKGDGSDRQIYRFNKGRKTWIGVTNSNIAENRAFFFLSKHLAQCGIPVPQIYLISPNQDCYLIEDLGHQTLADILHQWKPAAPSNGEAILKAYHKVLYWLPRIQMEGHQGLDYTFCFRESKLDFSVFQSDIEYFKNYFWNLFAKKYSLHSPILRELVELTMQLEKVEKTGLVLRDFQSRNIMWKNEEPFFIDYQMGCHGAIHYDLASLLYASSSGLNEKLREPLIDVYLNELQPWMSLSKIQFLNDFYCFVLIRRLRSLGTYGFLSSQKEKLHFLESIPGTIHEIHDLLISKSALRRFTQLKALFYEWKQDETLCNVSFLIERLQ